MYEGNARHNNVFAALEKGSASYAFKANTIQILSFFF